MRWRMVLPPLHGNPRNLPTPAAIPPGALRGPGSWPFFLRYGRVHRLGRGDVLVDSIQVRKVSGSNQIRYGPLVVTVYGLVRCLALIDDVLDSTAGYTEAG